MRRGVVQRPEVHHRGREDTEINVKRTLGIGGTRAPEGELLKILSRSSRTGEGRKGRAEGAADGC